MTLSSLSSGPGGRDRPDIPALRGPASGAADPADPGQPQATPSQATPSLAAPAWEAPSRIALAAETPDQSSSARKGSAPAVGSLANRVLPAGAPEECAAPVPEQQAALDGPTAGFSRRVRQGFGRRAAAYDQQARLQQGVAWRLGRLCRDLPLPAGPIADLGAGSGLLSRALLAQRPELEAQPPLQLDLCPELLARNPLAGPAACPWDLNRGLPPGLGGAALLISSFALQWLDAPGEQLAHWSSRLAPGGWLALALPVAGSLDSWQAAARAAAVPCTALPLPRWEGLLQAASDAGLDLVRGQRLRFSRSGVDGLATLRRIRCLGATASRQPPLTAGQLRRLLAHWPAEPLRWEVLLLLGRRPAVDQPPPLPC